MGNWKFLNRYQIKTSYPKLWKVLETRREIYRASRKFKNFFIGHLNTRFKNQQCKICGSKQLQIVYVDWARYILKCSECDICFAGSAKRVHNMYKGYNSKEYWETRRIEVSGSKGEKWKNWQDWKRQTFEKLQLGDFEKELDFPRKVLEIGCGEGKVLEVLKDRGWDVLGLDISERIVKTCQEAGLKVIAGSIEETSLSDNSFDLVGMFHLIEHLIEPLKALRKVFKILKKNGRLIIEMPFLTNEQDFLLDCKDLYHLFFFTEKSLQRMLNIAGFTYVDKLIYDDVFNPPRRNVCYMFKK